MVETQRTQGGKHEGKKKIWLMRLTTSSNRKSFNTQPVKENIKKGVHKHIHEHMCTRAKTRRKVNLECIPGPPPPSPPHMSQLVGVTLRLAASSPLKI